MACKDLKSRTPLWRMMRIHQYLLDGRYPNCSTLAREIEVSSKTIQRDLDYMRDQLQLPVSYANEKHGYCYTEPVTHFPTIPATEGEVLALFVAQKALEQYRGTPFEQPLANAFSKLAQVLDNDITISLQEMSETLSFHHTGTAITDMEVFERVTRALREHRELVFSYRKLNSKRARERRVQPYHLGSIDGQWYLFAHDKEREGMRTFVLGRIQDGPRIGRKFKRDKDFSLKDRLLGSFGVFSGEGNHQVIIEFDAFAAQLVRERTWHPSQSIVELAGDGLQFSVKLDSLEEIERWVLGWGSHATVIRPAVLKKSVQRALKQMQDNYLDSAPWFVDLHEAAQARQPERLIKLVLDIDRNLDAPGQLKLGLERRQEV